MSEPKLCPHCGSDQRGAEIPVEHLQIGRPDDWVWDGVPRFYSRTVGVEVWGAYDGVLYWMCPDCSGKWHRWPEDHPLRRVAGIYVDVPPRGVRA